MKLKILALVAALALSVSAFATSWTKRSTYYTQFSFDGVVAGKTVESVVLHAGVLQGENYYGTISNLKDVRDIVMTQVGDHFYAKAIFAGYSSPAMNNFGPHVQYFVRFTDGSFLITNPNPVSVKEVFNSPSAQTIKTQNEIFENASDAKQSSAVALEVISAS